MAKYQLLLPKMGESVAEATIIKWVKKPGDYIDTDEAVMEIATDKVDSEVPSPVSGKLVEQLCKENEVVQVGSVIAVIEIEEHKLNTGIEGEKLVQDLVPPVVEQPVEEVTGSAPAEKKINEPAAQTTEVEQKIIEPEEQYSETAQTDEAPVAYEDAIPGVSQLHTAGSPEGFKNLKSSVRFYSPLVKSIAAQEGVNAEELDAIPGTGADGRLTKDDLIGYIKNRHHLPVASPDEIPEPVVEEAPAPVTEEAPGPVIEQTPLTAEEEGTAVAPEEAPAAPNEVKAAEPVSVEMPVSDGDAQGKEAATAPEPVDHEPQPPAAAPISEEASEKTASVQPEPVHPEPVAAESKISAATSVSGNDEIIQMDRMGKLIAEHMVYSKHTSAHVTSFVEADVTHIVNWRERVKGPFEKQTGEKITYTPIFIEAVVKAIKDMPMINVSVNGTTIIKKKDINIGMATALPNGNLIVPVIKKAAELNLLGLTKSVNDLANRARNSKLLPDDVREGTFTLTNVGSFGNLMGTPIINQPQVAILAVGAIKKKPAVIETPDGDFIGIRHMMFLSLSYDHRVINGALGGSFLRRVADYLEAWDINRTI